MRAHHGAHAGDHAVHALTRGRPGVLAARRSGGEIIEPALLDTAGLGVQAGRRLLGKRAEGHLVLLSSRVPRVIAHFRAGG